MSELEKSGGMTGQSAQNPGLIIPVAITSLVMLIGMSFYQVAKYLLLPDLTLIKSNIITIFFSTTVATVAAYFVLLRHQGLLQETLREIAERRKREEEIRILNVDLEYHITQLESANNELEAFSYSVSHDLRAPLRHIVGYVDLLQKNASSVLDEKSHRYLTTISGSAMRMGALIDDLLTFSRIGRMEMQKTTFALEQLVNEVLRDLQNEKVGRDIEWQIGRLPAIYGDRQLIKLVFLNLLANAIKFTAPRSHAVIEIGPVAGKENETVVFVRDNGVGFDMKYSDKLFGVFQRLHSAVEFEGTGIGLANVQRIVHRHGGRTWAEGVVDGGATFYFSIPNSRRTDDH
jgi:light-regulated signal transduction histidine kinase (bacteriophytochrome)